MRFFLPILFLLTLSPWALAQKTLTVYTERKDHLVQPVFDAYTKKTGVKINFLTDNAATLIERLKGEGSRSPADLLLTVDAGNLWHATQVGLFQATQSTILQQNVPAHLRDAGHHWYGLSLRARTIVYNPTKIQEKDLKGFAQLAEPAFRKRLCLRSAKKVYNQSLVAMMIAENGEAATEPVVRGWVKNLAAPVFQDDTKLIEAIAAGQCDVGIANSYYFGRLQAKNPQLKAKLFFPKLSDGGTHVNISGAGVLKTAPNRAEAVKFLEWLSSSEAQSLFADANFEYPVNPQVKPHAVVQAWGTFESNLINVETAGEKQAQAIKLMDRAGYN